MRIYCIPVSTTLAFGGFSTTWLPELTCHYGTV